MVHTPGADRRAVDADALGVTESESIHRKRADSWSNDMMLTTLRTLDAAWLGGSPPAPNLGPRVLVGIPAILATLR